MGDMTRRSVGGGTVFFRRDVLRAAAATVGLPLVQTLGCTSSPATLAPPAPSPFTVPTPVFSVAERNRRWAALRAIMARPQWNLDAIITPGADTRGHNARYLTQITLPNGSQPAPEVLFPREERPVIALVTAARHQNEWTRRLEPGGWMSDGQLVLRAESGSAAVAKLLADEGYHRRGTRVGVAKLEGSRFDPEGSVSFTWFERLKAALPAVVFVPIDQYPPEAGNDTGPIEEASMSKSSEEQDVIRRSVAVNEQGLNAAVEAIRAGATRQADVWWASYRAMYAGAGEDVIRCSIGCGVSANATLGEPTDHPVEVGQFCSQEISSAYQGYGSQVNHTFLIGNASTPGYEYYRTAVELLANVIERAIAFIQPGKTTYGDFIAHNEEVFKELGHRGGGFGTHGGGLGYLSRPRQSEGDYLVVMQPGHCFDFKPAVTLDRAKIQDAGDTNRSVQLGESILVTDQGAVRLGTRPLVPITTA